MSHLQPGSRGDAGILWLGSLSPLRQFSIPARGRCYPQWTDLPASNQATCCSATHMHGRVQIIVSGVVLNSARLAVNTSYHSGDYQGCLSAGRWQAEDGAIWGIVPSSAFYPVLHRVHEESKGL